MRYLRYYDTRANFWRPDAIYERKSTIPNAIPYDTEYDTISAAGRTLKKYKWRHDAICWVIRAAKKYDTNQNTLKKYDTACLKKKCDTVRYYDTNLLNENAIPIKKPAKFFYSAGGCSDS